MGVVASLVVVSDVVDAVLVAFVLELELEDELLLEVVELEDVSELVSSTGGGG